MMSKPLSRAESTEDDTDELRDTPLSSVTLRGGYSLLLAVLITSTVLTAASALAGILVSEIRQTREITSAMLAQANAETATEEALFLLRKSDQSISDIDDPPALTLTSYLGAQFYSIDENDFIALPIPLDADPSSIDPQITVWDACDESWIEATAVSLDSGAAVGASPFQVNRAVFSPSTGDLPDFLACPTCRPTEMRLRALYCDINRLGIAGIPGRIRVVSTGQYGNVRQTIETLASRTIPVGGPFDFVLFSECEIVKGVSGDPICPP